MPVSVAIRFGSMPAGRPDLRARIRAAIRECIADEIGRLVELLDDLDQDRELEDDGTAEPSLGWSKTMAWGSTDDREEESR